MNEYIAILFNPEHFDDANFYNRLKFSVSKILGGGTSKRNSHNGYIILRKKDKAETLRRALCLSLKDGWRWRELEWCGLESIVIMSPSDSFYSTHGKEFEGAVKQLKGKI